MQSLDSTRELSCHILNFVSKRQTATMPKILSAYGFLSLCLRLYRSICFSLWQTGTKRLLRQTITEGLRLWQVTWRSHCSWKPYFTFACSKDDAVYRSASIMWHVTTDFEETQNRKVCETFRSSLNMIVGVVSCNKDQSEQVLIVFVINVYKPASICANLQASMQACKRLCKACKHVCRACKDRHSACFQLISYIIVASVSRAGVSNLKRFNIRFK